MLRFSGLDCHHAALAPGAVNCPRQRRSMASIGGRYWLWIGFSGHASRSPRSPPPVHREVVTRDIATGVGGEKSNCALDLERLPDPP